MTTSTRLPARDNPKEAAMPITPQFRQGHDRYFYELGQRSMKRAVRAIEAAGKPLTVAQVVEATGLTPQSAWRALQRAIGQKLVSRRASECDRRGRPGYVYDLGLLRLGECDIEPQPQRAVRNPFAVALGMVQAPVGKHGRVHRLADDEREAA